MRLTVSVPPPTVDDTTPTERPPEDMTTMQDNITAAQRQLAQLEQPPTADQRPSRYGTGMLKGLQQLSTMYAGTVPPDEVKRRRRVAKRARVARRANRSK